MNLLSNVLSTIFDVIIFNFVVSTILMKGSFIVIIFRWVKNFTQRFKKLIKFLFNLIIEIPKFNLITILILLENFLSNFSFFLLGSLFFFLIRLIFNTDVFDYDDILNFFDQYSYFFLNSEFYFISTFLFLKFYLLGYYFNLSIVLNNFL